MAQKAAVQPGSVPAKMLTCVGRSHLGDLGEMAVGVRICQYFFFFVCLSPLSLILSSRGNASLRHTHRLLLLLRSLHGGLPEIQ
jgi:hypothetical protein